MSAVPDIKLANPDTLYLAWTNTVTNLHSYLSETEKIELSDYFKAGTPIHKETAGRFAKIIAKTSMNNQIREAYIVDAWRFAGFKTYRMLNETKAIAYKSGKLLPADEILKHSESIYKRYNKIYLRAEIQQANNAALSAERWHGFDDTGKYYLQYRTAKDERVRDDHRILDGITLPKDDTFWSEFYPPNGWGCRCEVVEVLKSRYEKSMINKDFLYKKTFSTKNTKPFAFNPGQQLKLFPPTASYYNTGLSKINFNKIEFLSFSENYIKGGFNENTGAYWVRNSEHQFDGNEKKICNTLIDNNYKIVLIKDNFPNMKNFDAFINKKSFIETEIKTASSYRAIQSRIKKAKLQKAKIVVLKTTNVQLNEILRAIKGQIRKKENTTIERFIIISGKEIVDYDLNRIFK